MNTVDLIIKGATVVYDELQADLNSRYHSWEHCYMGFWYVGFEKDVDK